MLGPQSPHNPFSQKRRKNNTFRRAVISALAGLSAILAPITATYAHAQSVTEVQETVKPNAVKVAEVSTALPTNTAAIPSQKIPPQNPDIPAIEAPVKTINTTLIVEIDTSITVTLDGETLESTEVHRSDKGGLYVNAMPIFQALNNDFEYDDVSKALIVRRSQDGVVMELYTDTGIVKANGKALGKLKHFGEVSEGRFILTPNAIAVMSGANGRFNKKSNEFEFKLDSRLKVATGFEIFVNDIALGNLNPAPKSIGPVLILPLLPIAEALGHDVRVLDSTGEVFVRRAQDSAEFKLNLNTGLVKLRDVPYGISKDVTYIDQTNLLLPVSAIETLTGTNISTSEGGTRIEVVLDERLSGSIKPLGSVDDEAKDTPLTLETIQFSAGPDVINTVDVDFRVKRVNARLRYEIPDLPTSVAELEPSWLSLEYAHLNGVSGTVGDYSADFRELDGVGIRRIRGISANKVTDKGRWALTAGVPTQGAVRISNDQSRLTYGGLAAGGRYASRKGWEAGLALKRDNLTDDQMAVLSAISGSLGRKKDKKFQWDARADVGVFDGPVRDKPVDVRGSVSGRYDVNESVTVDTFVQYDGVEFLRTNLDNEDREDTITETLNPDVQLPENDAFIPDTRVRGADNLTLSGSVRYSPSKDIGFLNNPAASIRAQTSTTGVTVGSETAVTTRSVGASVATSIAQTGVSVSLDANVFDQSFAGDPENDSFGQSFGARAYKQFERFTVRAQYQNSNVKGQGVQQSANVNVTARSFNVPLPKDAGLSLAPSVSAGWTPESQSLRGGIVANFDSGDLLGRKTKLNASLGVLQSVAAGSNARGQTRTDKYLSVSVARRVAIGKNMALGLAYRNNLSGSQSIGLQLDGRFDFNEKRKYKQTLDGRGVLKGRAFVDENRDGIQQEGEPAVPNVLVRLKSTKLALRTDRSGFYTVQNVKVGLYDVVVDGRSLPLGYALSADVMTRATIYDGQITDVPLPIVQRGQIRGFTYVDDNGNRAYDKGEERIDSVSLNLKGLETDDAAKTLAVSTSFGQFAFDDLPDGEYTVTATSQPKLGLTAGEGVTLNLSDYDRLMAKIAIPVTRAKPVIDSDIREVKAAAEPEVPDPPPDIEVTMASP